VTVNQLGYSRDYAHQCSAWTINNLGPARKQCGLPVNANVGGWIYLCNRHYKVIEREFEDSLDDLNTTRIANLSKRLEAAETALRHARIPSDPWEINTLLDENDRKRRAQTVYFIRCQQYIKIGISKDPAARLRQIRRGGGSHFPRLLDVETAELIATEPGGLDRERELHQHFSHHRHTGEWFTEAPELTQYIDALSEVAA
jgi:predicted GIY-YIG superfamily endonuclease